MKFINFKRKKPNHESRLGRFKLLTSFTLEKKSSFPNRKFPFQRVPTVNARSLGNRRVSIHSGNFTPLINVHSGQHDVEMTANEKQVGISDAGLWTACVCGLWFDGDSALYQQEAQWCRRLKPGLCYVP